MIIHIQISMKFLCLDYKVMAKDKQIDTMTDRWPITEQTNILSTEKVWNKRGGDKNKYKLHYRSTRWLHQTFFGTIVLSEYSQCFDFLRGKDNAHAASDPKCPQINCGPIKQLVS